DALWRIRADGQASRTMEPLTHDMCTVAADLGEQSITARNRPKGSHISRRRTRKTAKVFDIGVELVAHDYSSIESADVERLAQFLRPPQHDSGARKVFCP